MFRTCFHFYFYFLFCVAELYDFPSKSEFSNRTLLLCVLCVVKHSAALKLPLSLCSVFILFRIFFSLNLCLSMCVSFYMYYSIKCPYNPVFAHCFYLELFFSPCIFIFLLYMSVRRIFNCPIAQNSFRCDSAFNFGLSC